MWTRATPLIGSRSNRGPMRTTSGFAIAASVFVIACGQHGGGGGGGGGGGPDSSTSAVPAFEIKSADVTLQPGEQITYCYYTHTSNTTTALVNKWVSDM